MLRRGIPVVVGPVPAEARDVLLSMSGQSGAIFVEADAGVRLESINSDGRTTVRLTTDLRDYGRVQLGLRGDHQVPNAVVAVRLLEQLEGHLPITAASITAGIRDVRWPGRLQMLDLQGGRRVLLDAAHNPAGARALASYLKREFPEPLPVVFGAMRDKDVSLMLKTLLPVASVIVMTRPDTPRAHDAGELATIARTLSRAARIEVESDPAGALERAWTYCPVICAAGSIFLVGNLLERIGEQARDV